MIFLFLFITIILCISSFSFSFCIRNRLVGIFLWSSHNRILQIHFLLSSIVLRQHVCLLHWNEGIYFLVSPAFKKSIGKTHDHIVTIVCPYLLNVPHICKKSQLNKSIVKVRETVHKFCTMSVWNVLETACKNFHSRRCGQIFYQRNSKSIVIHLVSS